MRPPERPFEMYFLGAEVPSWRTLLATMDAPMGVSFWGLYQRHLPRSKPYLIADRFPAGSRVFLDSGSFSVHSERTPSHKVTTEAVTAYVERYERFVTENIDAVTMVSEFDSIKLGREWMLERREALYNKLPPEKFMAVWHPEFGLDALREDAQLYEVIGVSATNVDGTDLRGILNTLARTGTRVHAVGMTKPEELHAIHFASAATTSWLSPIKFGDSIIWDGQRLHRYPVKYKAQCRRQHNAMITRQGFDGDAIEADTDKDEIVRYTVWAWLQQAAQVAARRPGGPVVDRSEGFDSPPERSKVVSIVDRSPVTASQGAPEPERRVPRPREGPLELLPVVTITTKRQVSHDVNGVEVVEEQALMGRPNRSLQACDSCYVSLKCPKFEAGAECAYQLSVSEAGSPDQKRALRATAIAMQMDRVQFMRLAEQLNGGYPDPNLSTELRELFKMLAAEAEIDDDRDSLDITIKGRAKTDTFARLFGQEPMQTAHPVIEGEVAHAPPTNPLRTLIETSTAGLRPGPH